MEVLFSADLQTKICGLAAQQGRDADGLIVEALERFANYDEWFVAEVERGLAQVEGGETLGHAEVGARVDHYLARASSEVSQTVTPSSKDGESEVHGARTVILSKIWRVSCAKGPAVPSGRIGQRTSDSPH